MQAEPSLPLTRETRPEASGRAVGFRRKTAPPVRHFASHNTSAGRGRVRGAVSTSITIVL